MVIDQLWHGVGDTTGANIVKRDDGVAIFFSAISGKRPAAIKDFLAAAFHLSIVPLNRREV